MGVDNRKLSIEQQAQVEQWEFSRQQVQKLTDIAQVLEHAVISIDKGASSNEEMLQNMGSLLVDVREQLNNLPKDAVEIPDQSKPVVEGLQKLEKELSKSIKGIELNPTYKPSVKVDAPQVRVDAPDLSGVEKILKNDLPKALDKAVSNIKIPDVPDLSVQPVVEKLGELEDILESIDRASRLKPQFPSVLKVTDTNGNSLNTGLVPLQFDYIEIPSYTIDGDPEVVLYKVGGAAGTQVARLDIAYSAGNIASVTRT